MIGKVALNSINSYLNKQGKSISSSFDDPLFVNNILIAFEAVCWMLSFTGLASSFLNKKNRILTYMTVAIFPIYIFHMPVQQFLAVYIYSLSIAPFIKLILMFFLTTLICILLYEVIKRLKGFRVVFGLKP